MSTGYLITNAVTEDEIRAIDWRYEEQADNHPIKFRIGEDCRSLYDRDTGEFLLRLPDSHRWYWFHSHLHIRPREYGLDATAQEQLRLKGDKPKPNIPVAALLGAAIGVLTTAKDQTKNDKGKQSLAGIMRDIGQASVAIKTDD